LADFDSIELGPIDLGLDEVVLNFLETGDDLRARQELVNFALAVLELLLLTRWLPSVRVVLLNEDGDDLQSSPLGSAYCEAVLKTLGVEGVSGQHSHSEFLGYRVYLIHEEAFLDARAELAEEPGACAL